MDQIGTIYPGLRALHSSPWLHKRAKEQRKGRNRSIVRRGTIHSSIPTSEPRPSALAIAAARSEGKRWNVPLLWLGIKERDASFRRAHWNDPNKQTKTKRASYRRGYE